MTCVYQADHEGVTFKAYHDRKIERDYGDKEWSLRLQIQDGTVCGYRVSAYKGKRLIDTFPSSLYYHPRDAVNEAIEGTDF